jgi:hypothetical protein
VRREQNPFGGHDMVVNPQLRVLIYTHFAFLPNKIIGNSAILRQYNLQRNYSDGPGVYPRYPFEVVIYTFFEIFGSEDFAKEERK